ncbi:hypothetical protein ABIC73_001966 [Prescottella equi]|uniref:hypothetical protein n=1 Tax=Rhodococcus hoagii TaxID=43767 RepID=UPI003394EB1C
MDKWVLSVVDVDADGASNRSSFGARGGTVQHLDQPTSFTAAPWSANWTPRRIPGGRD